MNVKNIGYGLVSFVPAIIIYGGMLYSIPLAKLMIYMGNFWALFVVSIIGIFGVVFYIFLKHFSKNKNISKKFQPYILIALIMASPISFPLYWLYFFVIKKV